MLPPAGSLIFSDVSREVSRLWVCCVRDSTGQHHVSVRLETLYFGTKSGCKLLICIVQCVIIRDSHDVKGIKI